MIISNLLRKILKEHDALHLIPHMEKEYYRMVNYIPIVNCGFSFDEYCEKFKNESELNKKFLYGCYRKQLDKLHKRI